MCELHQQSVDDDDSDINTKGNANTQYRIQYIHKYLSAHTHANKFLRNLNTLNTSEYICTHTHARTKTNKQIQNNTEQKDEYNQMLSMLSHAFTVTNTSTNTLIN